MKAFTAIPFFRIILPFLFGIFIGIKADAGPISLLYLLIPFILLVLLNFYRIITRNSSWLFISCADVFLLLFGVMLVHQKNLRSQSDYYGNLITMDTAVTFIATINDLPVEKEKFTKCELKVLEIHSGATFKPAAGTIYGYFKRSQKGVFPKAGQTVLVKTNLIPLAAPKNPFEFDYQRYLANKQVYHTAFIDQGSYTVLPLPNQLNLIWKLGLRCKEFILNRLKDSGLTKNAYGICAALLTGYDDEIDKPVMEAFSHSGTLHVLSVSGLHTGLIYLALNFLFNFFDPKKRYKVFRFIFLTLFLWFFALITGFSAPVLRAVIMFNLLGLGKIYFRAGYRHQINILLVSAFILLVYNPFYISDIGFLLSYFALFGLLYFQPGLSANWAPKNKILASAWQSITASVAATISTLPITLFYFKQFPLWFLVCNIVVVPATFLLLGLALGLVVKMNFISVIINYLVKLLVGFINLFNTEGFGFIDNIHFTLADAAFLSILIILLSVAFQYRSYSTLSFSLVVLIIWQFTSILESYLVKNESLLTVYNVKNNVAVAIKNKTRTDHNEMPGSFYNFNVKPHLNSFNYPELRQTTFNVVNMGKQFVVFLNHPGFWPTVELSRATTLVLSNNFKLSRRDLEQMKQLKTLVVDGSNNNYTAARTEELSRNFGVNFYNTRYKGAYLLTLQ